MRLSRKSKWIAAVAGVMTLGLAASAYAFFSSTGSGNGSATVGQSSNVDMHADEHARCDVPRCCCSPINLSINNPGTGTERVGTVTAVHADEPSLGLPRH